MKANREGVEAGEAQKNAAHALLREHRAEAILQGQRLLLKALLRLETATVDEIRDDLTIPPGESPKLVGVVPGPLARLGLIESEGFRKSTRPIAHARPVTVWRLVDRVGAVEWLRSHSPMQKETDGCCLQARIRRHSAKEGT